MFSVARDASKVALHALVQASLAQNVRLIDCQVDSEHLRSLGARSVPRREFMRELATATLESPPGASWRKA
jgi:leucyl/phenylalanyl-tRNA--protein transferase